MCSSIGGGLARQTPFELVARRSGGVGRGGGGGGRGGGVGRGGGGGGRSGGVGRGFFYSLTISWRVFTTNVHFFFG